MARHCGVSPRTATKWCDSGKLRAYRIPGSNDRRIMRTDLVRFLEAHGMPMHGLHEGCRVLLVGTGDVLAARLADLLPAAEGFAFGRAESAFEAGIQAESFHTDAFVIDLALGRGEAMAIARRLLADPRNGRARLFVLAGEDEQDAAGLAAEGFAVYRKPFDPQLLAETLRELR